MRLKGSQYFLIFIILLSTFVLLTALTWKFMEAKLLFLLFSSTTIVISAIVLVREVRTESKTRRMLSNKQANEDVAVAKPKEKLSNRMLLQRFGRALGWMMGFLALTYLLGSIYSIPVFIFTYLKAQHRGWLISGIFALGFTGLVYAVFVIGFQIIPHQGIIFPD